MLRTRVYFLILFCLPVLFANCQNDKLSGPNEYQGQDALEAASDVELYELAESSPSATAYNSQNAHPAGQEQNSEAKIAQQIIKTARLGYAVDSLSRAELHIASLVKNYGGYMSDVDQQNHERRKSIEASVRVPTANFDQLLAELTAASAKLGTGRLDYKQVNALDVTEEFVDLTSRLQSKRKIVARYQQLLNRANNIKDILSIEEKLRVLQEEIEAQEGRLRYLKNQVKYSTIRLEVYQLLDYKFIAEEQPGFGQRALASLSGGWQMLLSLIVGMLRIWPLVLIISLVLFFILRRRRNNSKTSL